MRANDRTATTPDAGADAQRDLIARALAGSRDAVEQLVSLLTPVIRARAARVLVRGARGRDVRASVDDVAQQVLLALFADHGKLLRSWDPARGMSLRQFVGLIAERQTLSLARSQRANPHFEQPTQPETLEKELPRSLDPESELAARELFHEIALRLRAELSPYGFQMFQQLFVEEKSPEQLSTELAMSTDAVYAWRSRLVRQVRSIAEKISSESARTLRTHGGRRSYER